MYSAFYLRVAAVVLFATKVWAENPSSLPGWTHPSGSQGVQQAGVITASGPLVFSSTVAADIDGQNTNGLEVAGVSSDGTVQVYGASGNLLWTARTPNADCGAADDRVYASPTVTSP